MILPALLPYRILTGELVYTGGELRPHFVLEKTGIYGSGLVAFVGPCHVNTDSLVDWEDRLASDSIAARSMLHFIGEFFSINLQSGVLLQRLFMAQACSILVEMGVPARRRGDDIYIGHGSEEKKLSVSIATTSSVSVLVHWALNIDASGAPHTVRAIGFNDLGWPTEKVLSFAKELLTQYSAEIEGVLKAQCKVMPVV
jgi:hypothetical protein